MPQNRRTNTTILPVFFIFSLHLIRARLPTKKNVQLFIHPFSIDQWFCVCIRYLYLPHDYFILITYVLDVPRILPFNRQLTQPIGSSLFLVCNAIQGSKPLRFEWFRDGHQLMGTSTVIDPKRYSIETRTTLSHFTLNDLTVHDSYANFSCSVGNDYGNDLQWTVLQVQGLTI